MNLETLVIYLKELFKFENNIEIDLLTLHNLLFYANLFSLQNFGRYLFEEEIVAHDHGPCVIGVKCPNEL